MGMSGEALYERYKDALKRGHVASLRDHIEDALAAYAEAAAIAPERSTPHTSAGTALLRRKQAAEALRHYAVALELSPRDEAALLGRAQALAALDRRLDAAGAFDALAELRLATGKLADAVDAARRGLELAEGRERRRTLERLIARLRASEPGEPGRIALERALLVLDGVAVRDGVRAHGAAAPDGAQPVATGSVPGDVLVPAEPAVEPSSVAGDPGTSTVNVPAVEPEAPYMSALDRTVDPALDAATLALLAEDAVEHGESASVLALLLDLAALYHRDGHVDGALDACYLALSIDPDDTGLHLALVELYDERGWTTLGTEKLDLVAALVGLDGDPAAMRRVATARSRRA
jgi:tetratricopeptide (TPR) repeat protein